MKPVNFDGVHRVPISPVPQPAQGEAGVLEALRNATREWHDQVETAADLLTPGVDRRHYTRFLSAMLSVIRPCEARLDAGAAPPGLDIVTRRKTPLLEGDLEALGRPSAAVTDVRTAALPSVHRWPHALGYLYVVEGSTLGGQVLLKRLVPALGLTAETSRFLRGYGSSTGSMWRSFAAHLETARGREQAIVECACATFALFHAALAAEP